jgi:hypothetical protein
MRPPKKDGRPTVVHFHVTVMGLDSIDENAMVIHLVLRMTYLMILSVIGTLEGKMVSNVLWQVVVSILNDPVSNWDSRG